MKTIIIYIMALTSLSALSQPDDTFLGTYEGTFNGQLCTLEIEKENIGEQSFNLKFTVEFPRNAFGNLHSQIFELETFISPPFDQLNHLIENNTIELTLNSSEGAVLYPWFSNTEMNINVDEMSKPNNVLVKYINNNGGFFSRTRSKTRSCAELIKVL